MKLEIKHFFDASHQLPDSEDLISKGCRNLHGHTYKVIVVIEGENNKHGMVIDFKAIKNLIDILDHRHINDVFKENKIQDEPTAENIGKFIKEKIEKDLHLDVEYLAICEGYKGEDRSSYVIIN